MTSDPAARMHAAFGPTSDPSAYVPRVAFESALAELVDTIGRSPACAALSGEAGLGKTLLLHVLAERLEGAFESLYVPFPRLEPSELWSWAAARLGIGGTGDDRAAVLKRARRRWTDAMGLVLLVDDAGALPRETRADLLQACDTSGFALVMAFDSGDRSHLQTLPPHVRRIELAPPMTLAETRTYLHARLRRLDPDGKIAARLGPAQIAELHETSGGVPARLHALLGAPPGVSPLPPRDVAPAERVESVEPVVRVAPVEHATPRKAPAPAPREERMPLPVRPALERRSTYRRARRRRFPLGLTALLALLLLAGIWRFGADFAPWSEGADLPLASVEPPREESAPAPPAEPVEVAPIPPAAEPPPAEALAEAPQTTEPVEAPAPPPAEAAPPAEIAAAPADVATAPAEVASAPPEQEPPAPDAVAASEPSPEPAAPPAAVSAPPPAAVASLAPARPGPRLSVNADPWASIELDGRPVGETPLGELPVAPGSHHVSARLPDGRVLERRIEVSAGGDVYVVFP